MLPNNSVLNDLSSLCRKLEMDQRFPHEKRKEAKRLSFNHSQLVNRHYGQPDLREHIEARAEHLGIEIVDLLAQLLQVDLNNAGETVEK
jgi:hypothetical protein